MAEGSGSIMSPVAIPFILIAFFLDLILLFCILLDFLFGIGFIVAYIPNFFGILLEYALIVTLKGDFAYPIRLLMGSISGAASKTTKGKEAVPEKTANEETKNTENKQGEKTGKNPQQQEEPAPEAIEPANTEEQGENIKEAAENAQIKKLKKKLIHHLILKLVPILNDLPWITFSIISILWSS